MRVTSTGSGPADKALDANHYLYVGVEKSGSSDATVPRSESGEGMLGSASGFAAYVKAREKNQ